MLGGMSDVGPCHVDGKEVYGPYVCGLWRWSSVGESDDMFMRAACGMPGEYIVVSRGVGVDQCHRRSRRSFLCLLHAFAAV